MSIHAIFMGDLNAITVAGRAAFSTESAAHIIQPITMPPPMETAIPSDDSALFVPGGTVLSEGREKDGRDIQIAPKTGNVSRAEGFGEDVSDVVRHTNGKDLHLVNVDEFI
jgi:hypothetical protein